MTLIYDVEALYFSLFMLLVFFIGVLFVHVGSVAVMPNPPILSATPRANFALINFATIALLLVSAALTLGSQAFTQPIQLRSFLEHQGMAYISEVYIVSAMIGMVQILEGRVGVSLPLYVGVNLAYTALTGRPSYMLTFLMTYIMYKALVTSKVPAFTLGVSAIVIPPMSVYILLYRNMAQAGMSIGETLRESWEAMFGEGLDELADHIMGRSDQLELFTNLTREVSDGVLPHDPLFPAYVLVQFIPRALWPDKPLNFTMEMTNHFAPGIIDAGSANNYLGLGEMYYAFGWLGVALAALVTGVMFTLMARYARSCHGRPGVFIVLYVVLFQYGYQSFISGYANDWPLPALLITVAILLLGGAIDVVRATPPSVPSPSAANAQGRGAG